LVIPTDLASFHRPLHASLAVTTVKIASRSRYGLTIKRSIGFSAAMYFLILVSNESKVVRNGLSFLYLVQELFSIEI
jgi:hypothetical protein